MAVFDRIRPGDVLWDVRKDRGVISRMASYKVVVVTIDTPRRVAMASWNDNRPELYTERRLKKLRRSPHLEKK